MSKTSWEVPEIIAEWERLLKNSLSRGITSGSKHGLRKTGEVEGIEEIRSGAILPHPGKPGIYYIEANTAGGFRRFRDAKETAFGDAQSDILESSTMSHRGVPVGGSWLPTVRVILGESLQWTASRTGRSAEKDHECSPQDILARLTDGSTSHAERRRLIIEAEVIDFSAGQSAALNAILRDFIEQFRDSNDPEDLVAVGSAVRKYVSTMSAEDLRSVAILLDAEHKAPIPLRIELELVKMVVRKLTANPPVNSDSCPELAERLADIAHAYLNARLLSREKYGAVTLNAVIGLLLLRSPAVGNVVEVLVRLDVPWFKQLLLRRLHRLREELAGRFSEQNWEQFLEFAQDLEKALCPHPS